MAYIYMYAYVYLFLFLFYFPSLSFLFTLSLSFLFFYLFFLFLFLVPLRMYMRVKMGSKNIRTRYTWTNARLNLLATMFGRFKKGNPAECPNPTSHRTTGEIGSFILSTREGCYFTPPRLQVFCSSAHIYGISATCSQISHIAKYVTIMDSASLSAFREVRHWTGG